MSFTFVDSGGFEDNASGLTIASPVISVAVNDLVVVSVKWEGASTSCAVSDGTSSLTQWSKGVQQTASGEPFLDVFYILASVASGSVTYTATLGGVQAFRDITVMVYRPSAAASLDGTENVGAATSGTTATSGNLTTTGTDGVAFAPYASYGAIVVSATINGVAVDHFIDASDQTAINHDSGFGRSALMARTYSAGFTNQASSTISSTERWIIGVIAFKISGGAPTVALEWKQPFTQPTSHYNTSIVMAQSQSPQVTPWLPTLPTFVTSTYDWIVNTLDIDWTVG